MSSTTSSLVIGSVTRLPPRFFEPFITSLRRTGYRGKLALLLGQYDDTEIRKFEELVDICVPLDQHYGAPVSPRLINGLAWMRNARGVRRLYPAGFALSVAVGRERDSLDRWRRAEYRLEGAQALRYGHYYDLLQDPALDADQILLTDVRDVLFQGDPFDPPLAGLEVFLEDPSRTIHAEPHNRRWIRSLYGPDELLALGQCTVSCSGTVAGPREHVLHYLREMSEAITWRRRPLGSHDQGVHNYLLRRGRFRRASVVPNGHGRVLTMGGMSEVSADGSGQMRNVDGTIPPILHQYDRHPIVAEMLLQRLAG